MTTTTTKAFELYNEFADSDTYNEQIAELARAAMKDNGDTEVFDLLITNFVNDTFGLNHRVLIEKISSDVLYDMAYEVV